MVLPYQESSVAHVCLRAPPDARGGVKQLNILLPINIRKRIQATPDLEINHNFTSSTFGFWSNLKSLVHPRLTGVT